MAIDSVILSVKTAIDSETAPTEQIASLDLANIAVATRSDPVSRESVIRFNMGTASAHLQTLPTSSLHLGQIDKAHSSPNRHTLALFEQRGLDLSLMTSQDNVVTRLSVASNDFRLVSAALPSAIAAAHVWQGQIKVFDQLSTPRTSADLIKSIIRPSVLDRPEFSDLRAIFANEPRYNLHVDDARHIRANHGWRVLAQLRVLCATLQDQGQLDLEHIHDKSVIKGDGGSAKSIPERLGSLDWYYFQPPIETTKQQHFFKSAFTDRTTDAKDEKNSDTPRTKTFIVTSDIISVRHHDRHLGSKGIGNNTVFITGLSAGATIIEPSFTARGSGKVFVGVRSIGVDVGDAIFGLLRVIPVSHGAEAQTPHAIGDKVPVMAPSNLLIDVHLAGGGIDVSAGGLKMTAIVEKLHSSVKRQDWRPEAGFTTSVSATYHKASIKLVSLASKPGRIVEYPVLDTSTQMFRMFLSTDKLENKIMLGLEEMNFETKAQLGMFLSYVQQWRDLYHA